MSVQLRETPISLGDRKRAKMTTAIIRWLKVANTAIIIPALFYDAMNRLVAGGRCSVITGCVVSITFRNIDRREAMTNANTPNHQTALERLIESYKSWTDTDEFDDPLKNKHAKLITAAREERETLVEGLRNLVFTAQKLWDDAKPIKDTDAMRVTHPTIEEAAALLEKQVDKGGV